MSRSFLAAAALAGCLAFAHAAQAASPVCEGEAKGAAQSQLTVSLVMGQGGKVVSRSTVYRPPSEGAAAFPMAAFHYQDDGSALGRPSSLVVGAFADLAKGPPASRTAQVEVTIDGRSWRVPWNGFASMSAQARRMKGGGQAAGLGGSIPVAYRGPDGAPLNPDLLDAAASDDAKVMRVRIVGDQAGEVFGDITYDLEDTATRDDLFSQAAAKAEEASRSPAGCKAR